MPSGTLSNRHTCVGGQVDTPGERCCTAKYLDSLRLKHSLHHVPIAPQHTRVVNAKSVVEQLLHLLIPAHPDIPPEYVKHRIFLT